GIADELCILVDRRTSRELIHHICIRLYLRDKVHAQRCQKEYTSEHFNLSVDSELRNRFQYLVRFCSMGFVDEHLRYVDVGKDRRMEEDRQDERSYDPEGAEKP